MAWGTGVAGRSEFFSDPKQNQHIQDPTSVAWLPTLPQSVHTAMLPRSPLQRSFV